MKRQPSFDDVKTTEAAATILQHAGGKMEYFDLIKILYLTDKEALARWERPVTFDNYVSMKYGQVLSMTYDLIKKTSKSESGLWEKTIDSNYGKSYYLTLKANLKPKKLSVREVKLLEEIYMKFKDYSWEELGQETKGSEYQQPNDNQGSIHTRFEDILKSLNFSNDDINRIDSALEDYSYIKELSEF